MTLINKKDSILYWGLLGLILYMPLHYYLCELLLAGTGIDNILRDLLIIALLALVVFTRGIRFTPLTIMVCVSCGVLAIFGVISTVLYRRIQILNILRTYLVPMLIFFICADVNLTEQRFARLNRFLVVELSIIAVYGFIQAFFLKDDFLIWLGYPGADGYLTSNSFYIAHFMGHQRSTGTFISPNICGIILAIAFIVLMFTKPKISFRKKYIWGVFLVTGLLATFSRSSFLGVFVATGSAMLLSRFWTRLSKKTLRRGAIVAATAGVLVLLDQLLLDGLFLRMLLSSIFRTFNGEDPSANAHLEYLTPPALDPSPMQSTDLPIRFGLNGPMAMEFWDAPQLVESSYYLMSYELWIPGAIIYFLPYIAIIVQTVLRRKDYPYFVPAAVSLAVLASYVFLPNVQTFEVPFYCFLFMGLYANNSVKALYQQSAKIERD